jgi:hypothetical protein
MGWTLSDPCRSGNCIGKKQQQGAQVQQAGHKLSNKMVCRCWLAQTDPCCMHVRAADVVTCSGCTHAPGQGKSLQSATLPLMLTPLQAASDAHTSHTQESLMPCPTHNQAWTHVQHPGSHTHMPVTKPSPLQDTPVHPLQGFPPSVHPKPAREPPEGLPVSHCPMAHRILPCPLVISCACTAG